MSVKCSICLSPERGQIDAQLEAGVRIKTIAQQFMASPHAVSRHKKHIASDPVILGDVIPDAEIALWLARLNDTYLLAGASGDVKTQISTASAAVRALVAEGKRRLREQAQRENANTLPTGEHLMSLEMLDEQVRLHREEHALREAQKRRRSTDPKPDRQIRTSELELTT